MKTEPMKWIWHRANQSEIEYFEIGKLLAVISGMAVFALLGAAELWRAGVFLPDYKIYALATGAACIALYLGAVVGLVRVKRKVKALIDAPRSNANSAN
jgi:hypothetical protein